MSAQCLSAMSFRNVYPPCLSVVVFSSFLSAQCFCAFPFYSLFISSCFFILYLVLPCFILFSPVLSCYSSSFMFLSSPLTLHQSFPLPFRLCFYLCSYLYSPSSSFSSLSLTSFFTESVRKCNE